MITLWNTMSGGKEPFSSLEKKKVGMYNCGPTVYNYAHIGNLRSYVFADILKRMLIYNKYKVNQVINITDVGHLLGDGDEGRDKIEEGARKEGKTAREVIAFYTLAFMEDLKMLNIDVHDIKFPRATEHIAEQIDLIKTLEQKGFTYKTSDGIYFDTQKFKPYGKLGNIDLAHLKEGARVTINSQKKHNTDFALWKFAEPHEKRQQEWQSPWGVGFPGWHIECSAMAMKYLGETFDIHTGGIDHIPVHHNNEIAQSECATGKEYVRFWLHNAFVNMASSGIGSGEKMAKSAGGFLRLADVVARKINPVSYRYWLLTAHYRSPITFAWEPLESANVALMKLVRVYSELPSFGKISKKWLEKFETHVNNDLNAPGAIAEMWNMIRDKTVSARDKKATLNEFDKVLGLSLKTLAKEVFALAKTDKKIPDTVKKLVKEREIARKNNDWKHADELRDDILKQGFELKDTENGTKLKRV